MRVVAGGAGDFPFVIQRQNYPVFLFRFLHGHQCLVGWFAQVVGVYGMKLALFVVTSETQHLKVSYELDFLKGRAFFIGFSVWQYKHLSTIMAPASFI